MLRSLGAVAALAVLVSGCMAVLPEVSGSSPTGCLNEHSKFPEAWACVRARLVAKRSADGHPDGLIDEGDILAAQVNAGKVSDAEARKRLTVGLAHDAS